MFHGKLIFGIDIFFKFTPNSEIRYYQNLNSLKVVTFL